MASLYLTFSNPVNKSKKADFKVLINNELNRILKRDIEILLWHFINENSCIIFLEGIQSTQTLLQHGNLIYRGNSIKISAPSQQQSPFLHVSWFSMIYKDIVLDDIGKFLRQLTDKKFSLFSRTSGVLIQCDKSATADKLSNLLNRKYSNQIARNEVAVQLISFDDYNLLKCSWQSNQTLSEVCSNLSKMGRSYTEMLQSVLLCNWVESPCIIMNFFNQENISNEGNNFIYFVVPTYNDYEIFKRIKSIVFYGGTLNLIEAQTVELFIFW